MNKMLSTTLISAIMSLSASTATLPKAVPAPMPMAAASHISMMSAFDKKMIEVQKQIIAKNKNFKVNSVSIDSKKKIDKKWTMYTFNLSLFDKQRKQKFTSPMIIFTDGKYETNSLTNINTGERYELIEQRRLRSLHNNGRRTKRDKFEKSYVLPNKYYNKEHLISGNMNAKNKVVIISDPLCIACIGTFPRVYNLLKDNKDYALFYYHYPLRSLHPTSEVVSKAMALATKNGIKNVEKKIFDANLDEIYKKDKKSVYKEKSESYALSVANKVLGTNYTLDEVKKVNLKMGDEIAKDVKLTGTPTVILNGSLYHSRQKLAESLSKNQQ